MDCTGEVIVVFMGFVLFYISPTLIGAQCSINYGFDVSQAPMLNQFARILNCCEISTSTCSN